MKGETREQSVQGGWQGQQGSALGNRNSREASMAGAGEAKEEEVSGHDVMTRPLFCAGPPALRAGSGPQRFATVSIC